MNLGRPGYGYDVDAARYNIFRWYRAGWGRYTQSDPVGVGGLGARLPDGRFLKWEAAPGPVRARAAATALTLFAYADDNPLLKHDRLGLIIEWLCTATAVTGYSTSRPLDPQNPNGSYERLCAYNARCFPAYSDMLDDRLWWTATWYYRVDIVPRGRGRSCPCPRYCSFTYYGWGPTSESDTVFFGDVTDVRCGETLPQHSDDDTRKHQSGARGR